MPLGPAARIRPKLRAAFQRDISDAGFRARVAAVLGEYPHALHREAKVRPSLIALGAFEAAGGDGISGDYAAAAMETLIAACHVLDRLADRDHTVSSADLQIAPTLLFLTGQLLEESRTRGNGQAD